MLETSARLLRLLSLLQTPRDWTGAELAERLSISTRTVRNDVGRLRNLGYPVHGSRGAVGGYRLGAGAALPPLWIRRLGVRVPSGAQDRQAAGLPFCLIGSSCSWSCVDGGCHVGAMRVPPRVASSPRVWVS